MKKIYLLLPLLCITGCYSTTWECYNPECQSMSYSMASNKCLSQANAAFSNSKQIIWEQCMKGYGFTEIKCEENKSYKNPCAPLGIHVM